MARGPAVKFEWKGVQELKTDLEKVGLALDDRDANIKRVLLKPCIEMRDNARHLAPKKTGALAAAIYATRGGDRQRGILMGVRKKVHYARFVEFGTSKMAAHPYFRPALLGMSRTFVDDIAPGIKKIVEDTAAANAFHPPD